MNSFDPTILGPLSMAAGLSLAMVWLAARVSMIELRRPSAVRHAGAFDARALAAAALSPLAH